MLNDWPLGKQWVLFLLEPQCSPRGTLRVSGKQNSMSPLGPVIKCWLNNIHNSLLCMHVATTSLLIIIIDAFWMASFLNNPILVLFKAAWALYMYFPWYTIYYWPKRLTYKGVIASFAHYITTVTFSYPQNCNSYPSLPFEVHCCCSLRWFPQSIPAIRAKIRLPKKTHGMGSICQSIVKNLSRH